MEYCLEKSLRIFRNHLQVRNQKPFNRNIVWKGHRGSLETVSYSETRNRITGILSGKVIEDLQRPSGKVTEDLQKPSRTQKEFNRNIVWKGHRGTSETISYSENRNHLTGILLRKVTEDLQKPSRTQKPETI
ncbi:hypothetical protein QYM36_006809 [Artemia franciscana]|uniref:Uncharacterized protein n=1 Tax=Artemia franciscana TaxID=6661 RepID=A0AA88L8M1_ARTSF|nr:hypothetical protein QYM36_006809 [Artemia franciscana]